MFNYLSRQLPISDGAEWQAKGAARERAFRRKVAFAAPIVILVVAVILYALVGR